MADRRIPIFTPRPHRHSLALCDRARTRARTCIRAAHAPARDGWGLTPWARAAQIVTSDAPSDVPSGSAVSKYIFLVKNSLTMLPPAAIYLAMNILGFLSLQYIDAATFAIIAQVRCRPNRARRRARPCRGGSAA